MTAQPEVVWVTWYGDHWYTSLDPDTELPENNIRYVPEASLTAALAERDAALSGAKDNAAWSKQAELDMRAALAERDKLAKTLSRASELLIEYEWVNDGDGDDYCATCSACRTSGHEDNCALSAFLTAQAAQGENKTPPEGGAAER